MHTSQRGPHILLNFVTLKTDPCRVLRHVKSTEGHSVHKLPSMVIYLKIYFFEIQMYIFRFA